MEPRVDQGPERRRVYRALLRPLTVLGVDRRLFFASLLAGAVTFNVFYSLVVGCLVFASIHAMARWSATHDPRMFQILIQNAGRKPRYDAARPAQFDSAWVSHPW
jgi:type IV secretory pathway TrbD component